MELTRIKVCPRCGQSLPYADFRYKNRGGFSIGRTCNECRRIASNASGRRYRKFGPLQKKAPIWTDEKIATVIRLYPDTPNKVIADAIGLNAHNVSNKAQLLGLRKTREHLHKMHVISGHKAYSKLKQCGKVSVWTEEKERMLCDLFPCNKTLYVAGKIGMTPEQCKLKAKALGLHKTPEHIRKVRAITKTKQL